jgi:hypothetical protein
VSLLTNSLISVAKRLSLAGNNRSDEIPIPGMNSERATATKHFIVGMGRDCQYSLFSHYSKLVLPKAVGLTDAR